MVKDNTNKRLDSGRKGFREAYDNLPCKTQRAVRNALMHVCEWGMANFYYKLNGKSKIYKHEEKAVAEAFGLLGFDAWTGNKI